VLLVVTVEVFVLVFLGLALGSFANVCVYRLPRDESPFLGRSECPHCEEQLPWYDNIPVFSYILLSGRCRFCGGSISLRYPLGELIGGIVFAIGGFRWVWISSPEWTNFFVFVFFVMMCVTISRIDFHESIIPNELNYSFLLVGLLLAPITHHPLFPGPSGYWYPGQLRSVLGGLLLGGGLFFLLAVLSPLFYGKPALGMGDVKLMGAMGVWLGGKLILLALALGSIIGALVGTTLMLVQGRSLRTEIPFGPFLCIAGIVVLVSGHEIFDWYLGLL
jgi:leader peptidase (prepilin peptidase)/N-methyltransferase